MVIIHIATRMRHHSPHSGYDRMSDFLRCQRYREGTIFKGLGMIPDWVWGVMLRKSKLYLVPELKQEIELQIRSWRTRNGVYHFLYGENEYRHFRPPRDSKLFVTYHFPPKKYEEYFVKPQGLRRVNAVIVVGTNQIDYFAKWFPREKIVFVPHGVDTEFFSPPNGGVRENKVLFVGTHLRDFNILRSVVEKIERHPESPIFTIVTFRENWYLFKDFKNVKLLSDISETELLRLYQTHALLFLPILDGTANNTLLEAAACGLAIITTDIGSVRDYLDDNCAILMKTKNINIIISNIIELVKNETKREELSMKSRIKMESYDWKIIASRIEKVYREY